jgi:FKBP12-rapamycin complex-associated protein
LVSVLKVNDEESFDIIDRVLGVLPSFGRHLEDYLYLIVPSVVKLFEETNCQDSTRALAIDTIGKLSKYLNFAEYAGRIIHPLCRVLKQPIQKTKDAAVSTLCVLVLNLRNDFLIFSSLVNKVMNQNKIVSNEYNNLMKALLKNELDEKFDEKIENEENEEEDSTEVKKMHSNQSNLKKAW